MRTHLLALVLFCLPFSGLPQEEVKTDTAGAVTITSNGSDIRKILHDLFTQAKKSYVLEPYFFNQIHLNLVEVPFADALEIICKIGKLKYEDQNGIIFITRDEAARAEAANTKVEKPAPVKPKRLDPSVLDKKVTTKLIKTDLREVFASFGKQAEIKIEVHAKVPQYKIDAVLVDTPLKNALDVITKTAGLKYRFSDNLSIEIYKPEPVKGQK
jgi:type II secretory pathway component GspD/PulD (secretin)